MNKIAEIAKNATHMLRENSPIILTATAVGGVVTTGILTHRAALLAARDINQAQYQGEMLPTSVLSREEKIKLVWKHYIPPFLVGGATVASIIGAQSINMRRQAALLGLYTVTETAYREYQEKNLEVNGKSADRKVRDGVAQDRVNANPPDNSIIISGTNILVYDTFSGRYFQSSMEDIRKAQNDVNEQIIGGDMYCSLDEFYQRIGLNTTKMGQDLGFTLDNLVDIDFSSVLTPDGKAALSMTFRANPVSEYYRFR